MHIPTSTTPSPSDYQHNESPEIAWPKHTTLPLPSLAYDMSSPSTFLTLPGEIRNHIYLQIALDAPIIRLFEGRVVLPPLAGVCRQTRKEMNGKYQHDATLNPATPIHALVTNFNFHSLDRWLDRHSRDLKDKMVASRVLCITSVLLAPDAAANCSISRDLPKDKTVLLNTTSVTTTRNAADCTTGHLPPQSTRKTLLVTKQEALERTTSAEYQNALRVLEQSLEAWCYTWTLHADHLAPRILHLCRKSGISELDSASTSGQADRSGTSYMIKWRTRIVHREHPKPRARAPHNLQRTGLCYRGDFCDHFVFRHMDQIMSRARARRSPQELFVKNLKSSMCSAHLRGINHRGPSEQLRTDDCSVHPCGPCKEVVKFYEHLNDYNAYSNVFEDSVRAFPSYRSLSKISGHGRKRAFEDASHIRTFNIRLDGSGREDRLNHVIYKMGRLSLDV